MEAIPSLLLLLLIVSVLHVAIFVYNGLKFFIPNNSPGNSQLNYNQFHPANNIGRVGLSVTFLLGPLLILWAYRSFPILNETIDIIVLGILIALTVFFSYFNHYKIWSESFRTVPNPKIISEQSYSEHQKELKIELDKIKENEKEVQEKYNSTTTSLNSLSFELGQVKTKVLTKDEKNLAKQNKPFADYFHSREQFQNFETLLQTNNFSKKSISVINLCILTCKLIDLKVIDINQEQKYYCTAIASYFDIPVFDSANLSRVLKDKREGSFSNKHQEFYNILSYLDKPKEVHKNTQ